MSHTTTSRRSLRRLAPIAVILTAASLAWAHAASADVYWANFGGNSIGRASLDGTGVNQSFISTTFSPGMVAVDGGHIYYSLATTIARANLDGTGVNENFISVPDGPGGIAVDGGHIYWTSGDSIGRANLDGTDVDQNFISVHNTGSVAVDGGHIYWNQAGLDASIGRANLDGTDVDHGFIAGIAPHSVAVDAGHIYWADNGTIGSANLDGTGVDRNFITGVTPSDLAVDASHIYWTDNPGGTIGRANLDGSGANDSFITGADFPAGIAVDAITAASPTVDASPSQVDFGPQPRTTIGDAHTVTVSVTGNSATFGTLSVAGASAGDFLIDRDTCSGRTLAAGSSCTAQLRFAPQVPGADARSATLQIPYSGPGVATGAAASDPLSGTAVAAPGQTGPAGPSGSNGAAGPQGSAGSRGAAGKQGRPGHMPLLALFFTTRYAGDEGHRLRVSYFTTIPCRVTIAIHVHGRVLAVSRAHVGKGRHSILWDERYQGRFLEPGDYAITLRATSAGQATSDRATVYLTP